MEKKKINIRGQEVKIVKGDDFDFICLTDIVKVGGGNPQSVLENYLRNKGNINFMGAWETLYNEKFNTPGFEGIRNRTGDNDFYLSFGEWKKQTGAVGIYTEKGKYGGTYAHDEIAIQFSNWFNPLVYIHFIKAFKELAAIEKKSTQFYLNKIFNNTLEANQLTKFLIEGQKSIEDKKSIDNSK